MRLTVESLRGERLFSLKFPASWSQRKCVSFVQDLGRENSDVFVGLSFDEYAPDVFYPSIPDPPAD